MCIRDRKREWATMVVTGGKLTAVAGDEDKKKTEFMVPRINETLWTKWINLASDHIDACSVAIDKEHFLVIGGGNWGLGGSTTVTRYNVVTGESKVMASMAEGRYGHGCALVKTKGRLAVLVAGGHKGPKDTSELYDIENDTWESVGSLTSVR